jgi:hypothetical protein
MTGQSDFVHVPKGLSSVCVKVPFYGQKVLSHTLMTLGIHITLNPFAGFWLPVYHPEDVGLFSGQSM